MLSVGSPVGTQTAGRRAGEGAVTAAFQPIFDLRDGTVVGYEALARPRDGSSPATVNVPASIGTRYMSWV